MISCEERNPNFVLVALCFACRKIENYWCPDCCSNVLYLESFDGHYFFLGVGGAGKKSLHTTVINQGTFAP